MQPLRSARIAGPRRYYELLRPCAPHRYLHPRGGHPLGLFPWHRSDRFSRSTPEPDSGSRRLCAERHPAHKQAPAGFVPGSAFRPGFDAVGKAHDTSSAVHSRSSPRTLPATILSWLFLDVHHDDSLPSQLEVVWSLVLQLDSGGPSSISDVVGVRSVTARSRDTRTPPLFSISRAPSRAACSRVEDGSARRAPSW